MLPDSADVPPRTYAPLDISPGSLTKHPSLRSAAPQAAAVCFSSVCVWTVFLHGTSIAWTCTWRATSGPNGRQRADASEDDGEPDQSALLLYCPTSAILSTEHLKIRDNSRGRCLSFCDLRLPSSIVFFFFMLNLISFRTYTQKYESEQYHLKSWGAVLCSVAYVVLSLSSRPLHSTLSEPSWSRPPPDWSSSSDRCLVLTLRVFNSFFYGHFSGLRSPWRG